eukprot:364415-Chlamydomonas_euryale.AAC.11
MGEPEGPQRGAWNLYVGARGPAAWGLESAWGSRRARSVRPGICMWEPEGPQHRAWNLYGGGRGPIGLLQWLSHRAARGGVNAAGGVLGWACPFDESSLGRRARCKLGATALHFAALRGITLCRAQSRAHAPGQPQRAKLVVRGFAGVVGAFRCGPPASARAAQPFSATPSPRSGCRSERAGKE